MLMALYYLQVCRNLQARVGELGWLKRGARQDGWSAYYASIQEVFIPPSAIIALLPLFLERAHSIATIKHSMTVVQAAVQHLNPCQVPVLAADQPLFALAMKIQWTGSSENHFVIMFGGLHIEMAVLRYVYITMRMKTV